MTGFLRGRPDSAGVTVKLQPKSRRAGIQGHAASARGTCLRIGVAGAAPDGRANRAACAVLAAALHVPAAAIAVILGQTSGDKTLHVAGDTTILTAALESL